MATPILAVSYTITVQSDYPTYSGVSTIHITGQVSPAPGPNTAAFVSVLNPHGDPVDYGVEQVDANTGAFSHSTVTGGAGPLAAAWISGTYTVNASWGSSGTVAYQTATFAYTATTTTTTQTTTTATTTPASSITVSIIDVGQGDSIFVDTPSKDVLIDGGPRSSGTKVVQFLNNRGITKLDYLIATHADADHIGGLITVLQSNIRIDNVMWNGRSADTQTYRDWFGLASQHPMSVLVRGQNYTLANGVWMFVLNPTNPVEFSDSNDNSIVVKIQIGKIGFMLTGDCEQACEASILNAKFDLESQTLKVGHHGSRTSTSPAFLSAVTPSVAVISAGLNNQYGHPHQEVIDRLLSASITIYGTYQSGDIVVIGYPDRLQVTGQPQPIPEFPAVFVTLFVTIVAVLVLLKFKKPLPRLSAFRGAVHTKQSPKS
ncbi:MAG: MBL fold metallo-hydrolase [Thaumarchaeota archaeon]|nr:MBL fold metallo-hydrolase [Nitrososphaerota archaeon]